MLKTTHRNWIIGLGATAVVAAVALVGSGSVSAAPSSDWALNSTQQAQARQALMLVATQADPSASAKSARAAGAWPSNIAEGSAFGTDRATANAAMGEPKAAPAEDTRPVVCAEARGKFSNANTPRPYGSPVQTFSYAVVCFDPATGDILDSGYDNKPLTGKFTNKHSLNVTSAITSIVK